MPTPIRLDGLLAKIEGTYGVDSVPVVGTDGVRVSERVWSSLRMEYAFPNERTEVATGGLGPAPPAGARGRIVTLEIAWEGRGAGAAYSASVLPEADPLLRACGMSRADDFTGGLEKVTYSRADTSHASCTIYAYAGGLLFKIVGCRGNVRWPINAGQIGVMRFAMQGILVADPATTALPAITYDAVLPPPAVSMGLAISSWTPDVVTGEFNQASQISRLDSGNAAEGVGEFAIAHMQETAFNLTARSVPLATYDPYTVRKNSTPQTVDLTLGSAQYNRVKLDVNDARLRTIEHPEDQGFTAWDLSYFLLDFAVIFD